jgi:ATP adenylyltransferase
MAYLSEGKRAEQCFLCVAADGARRGHTGAAGTSAHQVPVDSLPDGVVWQGARTFALLNAYPYASGHVMIAPYEHLGDLGQSDPELAAELMVGAQVMIKALSRMYSPEGFNLGMNLGDAAGAGYGDHIHLHVVPRWGGDTNFMTTVGMTRVIPEDLRVTETRLRAAVQQAITERDKR